MVNKSQIALLCFFAFLGTPVFSAPHSKAPAWFPEQDRKAYELLMGAYQKRDVEKLKSYEQIFVQRFTQSPLKDNATYLLAQLQMERQLYRQAIPTLSRIIKNDPLSERWPAAVYARGLAYKELGMNSQAITQWKVLLKRFPGSRESQKAWVAMRLMDANKKTN